MKFLDPLYVTCRRPWFDSWVRKIHWRRDRLPTPVFLGFPCGSAGKESTCNAGHLGSIPGLGRAPGEGKGNHCSILAWKNSMFMGSQRVGLTWVTFTSLICHMLLFLLLMLLAMALKAVAFPERWTLTNLHSPEDPKAMAANLISKVSIHWINTQSHHRHDSHQGT